MKGWERKRQVKARVSLSSAILKGAGRMEI